MSTLVIYSHPNTKSFNHAIFEQVVRGLKEGNHSYNVIDLYKDKFNPVLFIDENTKGDDLLNDPETAGYRKLISEAQRLIFIYPIWWYGLPAMMKGFIDRVFVSGFAYSNKGGSRRGLFGDKSAWVIYTIDSPSWFIKLFRHSIEWKTIKDAILNYCGIMKVERTRMTSVKTSSVEKKIEWLDKVYQLAKKPL